MIGRNAERARLARCVADTTAGRRAQLVAVVGPHGMGKTTLLDAVRADAVAAGATVLATKGRSGDADLPFASLLTLLNPVDGALDRLAGDLAVPLRHALALPLPLSGPSATPGCPSSLTGPGRVAATAGQRVSGASSDDARAVGVAVFRVLSGLAGEGALVVLIDDAHLLDPTSADVLAFAVGRLGSDRVLTVVAAEQYIPSAVDELGPETLVLDPLPDPAVAEIIRRSWPARDGLAAAPLQRCVGWAEGNPLAGIELAASLDPAQRSGAMPVETIPRLRGTVGTALARRLVPLTEPARTALATVAADATGELALVTAALRRLGHSMGALGEAEAAGLITTVHGGVRFTHPLMRAVAYHQIGVARRRALHAALAAVLAPPARGASRACLRTPATAPPLASLLSPAEQRVALAVAEGRTNQQAADTLYVSAKTIDFHLQNIYRKLRVRSRTQLAVVVHQRRDPFPMEVAS